MYSVIKSSNLDNRPPEVCLSLPKLTQDWKGKIKSSWKNKQGISISPFPLRLYKILQQHFAILSCLIILNQPSPAAGEALPVWTVCCLNPEVLFWASPNTLCVFVSFSLQEIVTFCSRRQSSSQGCASRVGPFSSDAAPLAGVRIHWNKDKNANAEKAGGRRLQRGDLSQNKVSKTAGTQISLWLLKKQFRNGVGGREFVFALLQGMLRNTEPSPTQYIFCVLADCACLSSGRQRNVLY